jgi:hypothetical protein
MHQSEDQSMIFSKELVPWKDKRKKRHIYEMYLPKHAILFYIKKLFAFFNATNTKTPTQCSLI